MSDRPTASQDRAELARLRKQYGDEKMKHLAIRGGIFHLVLAAPDGKDFTRSTGTREVRTAWKIRDDKVSEIRMARGGKLTMTPISADRETVRSVYEALEAHYTTHRLKSLRQFKSHAVHVLRLLGSRRALAITQKVLDDFATTRRKECKQLGACASEGRCVKPGACYSDTTIERERELIVTAIRFAGIPLKKTPKLVRKDDNARQGFYSRAEFEARVAEFPSDVLKDLARWGFATAMRLGSILTLTWAGFDRESWTLRLHQRDAKTRQPVVVPLKAWPALEEIIKRRLAARLPGCDLVFHNGHGKRLGDFYGTWTRAGKRAKVRHRTFHDLRRTGARNLRAAGVPESIIMAIGGWKTDAMFRRYAIVDEADLASAFAKGSAYVATLPTTMEEKGTVVPFGQASNPASNG